MERIAVCLPTYCGAVNGEDDLLGWSLRAVRERTRSRHAFDLYVLDDSGREEHRAASAVVAARYDAFFFAHEQNRGVAAAWNSLTRASAPAEQVVILNDDLIVSPGWLDALVYFLDANPGAGSAGLYAYFTVSSDVPLLLDVGWEKVLPRDPYTKEYAPDEVLKHSGREQPGRVMAPTGCGFGFRREVYDRTIGFDESLGKAFYEEADWGVQCALLGLPSYCLQWPMGYHIWSETFRRSPELVQGDPVGRAREAFRYKWYFRLHEIADLIKGAGDCPQLPIHRHLMGRIPFQKVRWLDPDGPREELITGEDGYFRE